MYNPRGSSVELGPVSPNSRFHTKEELPAFDGTEANKPWLSQRNRLENRGAAEIRRGKHNITELKGEARAAEEGVSKQFAGMARS